jgi:CCR4-NOT transcriptional complex subunit CAF120
MRLKYGMNVGAENGRLSSPLDVGVGHQFLAPSEQVSPLTDVSARDSAQPMASIGSLTDEALLHPEVRSVASLVAAHVQKIYFSGPLVYKLDRNPNDYEPHEDGGWREIWAQLGGTTLSIWDMGEVKIASQQGKEVLPSYVNITEAVRPPFHLHLRLNETIIPSSFKS